MTQTQQPTPPRQQRRGRRPGVFAGVVVLALLLLFGVPWATVVLPWSAPVVVAGTVLFGAAALAFPVLMFLGHARGRDWAARLADTTLGVVWVLFAWSVLSLVARVTLLGVAEPQRSRIIAVLVLVISLVLVGYGVREAMRVPRIRRLDVTLPRLGPGLDGTTVALLTDTHFGPLDRTRWSRRTAAAVNELTPDIVVHAGDIADGTVEQRRAQVAPLGTITASLARVYSTGNHEYFGEAQAWLDHLTSLGWEALHNRHITVGRGGDSLVVAGIDDATALASGLDGHGAELDKALDGAPADTPVLLLAHQPKQIAETAGRVDLQLSGHTHGGQIWPFHYLVRTDQPVLHGLSQHGPTQLYTSRGAGFWGPPLRVFAPSEITLLTLRSVKA
ncbi:metallophosphoesterase [Amycolatopsis albispora]|uniref:Metallophosphoesterase n=1 Tax=Amycolatopsis albispora TaxID=1804986 RepID=A0A344L5S0_9PSEU|nr:metallophosphoesterase [Amycolatopsis albispora]AXB43394.1 metallophosphoesterase [Amycolatopsis albispora]